jgi:hypothetical protein
MNAKLLIINCPSPYFGHIPMGTFGLCDFLNQSEITARILNLSLYEKTKASKALEQCLETFQPTHVGLPMHWQETAEGVIAVAQHVKAVRREIKIICGGFTAGYFGESFLESQRPIDYVIKGDPEEPLKLLLTGTDPGHIPNVIYRDDAGIRSNDVSYCIDPETLSAISFSKLPYLFDHDLYVEAVERRLGFPVFVGRGCVFGCDYCGGSRKAFRLHGARTEPVTRSIQSMIADLKRLAAFTKKIYICYEVDRSLILGLFRAMERERDLVKVFQLNYGAWALFDDEFLNLYKKVFVTDGPERPLFELSPEVFDDRGREKVKGHQTYSIEALKDNVRCIDSQLDQNVKVYVFFSRYHDTAETYSALRDEIFGIFRLKYEFFSEALNNAKVYYDHLSTDIASTYWEKYVSRPGDFDTLTSSMRQLESRKDHPFPLDNLCIFRPKALTEEDMLRCELLVFILKRLETVCHEFFYILFSCLDRLFLDLLETLIEKDGLARRGNVFESPDECELLRRLEEMILENSDLLDRIPFIKDLTAFEIKKVTASQTPRKPKRPDPLGQPQLNHRLISINEHDYTDTCNFLKRIEKDGVSRLSSEKTVFVFLSDEIVSMPYETYQVTLQAFESETSLKQYYRLMKERQIFDRAYHEGFLSRMFEGNVLS